MVSDSLVKSAVKIFASLGSYVASINPSHSVHNFSSSQGDSNGSGGRERAEKIQRGLSHPSPLLPAPMCMHY